MLKLTEKDIELVNVGYKNFLAGLRSYLQENELNTGVEYANCIVNMLHSGLFSIEGKFTSDTEYKYLPLSNVYSEGIQVMYGKACCRHTNAFVSDELQFLGFDATLLYTFVDGSDNWYNTTPIKANHVSILLKENGEQYIIDSFNKFICRKENEHDLTEICFDDCSSFDDYQDENIQTIGKVLKKYYGLQSLGIKHIYEYDN